MGSRDYFNSAVDYLAKIQLDNFDRPYLSSIDCVVNSFDAIETIGLYMGRPDIEFMYADMSIMLGDTPALQTISYVLAEVQKFRENEEVSRFRRLKRWVLFKVRKGRWPYQTG